MVASGPQTVGGNTQTVDGGTLTVANGTRTINGSTLMIDDGTQTSDNQHQLDSAVAGMTRLHRHLAKQHPQDEDPSLHVVRGRVGFNKDHCPPCVHQGINFFPSSYFIVFLIFICRSDQMSS
jgi:hypothetical protein